MLVPLLKTVGGKRQKILRRKGKEAKSVKGTKMYVFEELVTGERRAGGRRLELEGKDSGREERVAEDIKTRRIYDVRRQNIFTIVIACYCELIFAAA